MLILPNPNSPADGQALDATPLMQNITAIAQAIESFDGSQIQTGTVAPGALITSANPNTILHDTLSPFVVSGLIWTSPSGLTGTMTGGTAYIANATQMFRLVINGIGSQTFAASSDTYVDIDYNANVYYLAVANGAASPALTANSIRIAKIVTSSTAVTSVVQSGSDSLGNLIYNQGPITLNQIASNTINNNKIANNTITLANIATSALTQPSGSEFTIGGIKVQFTSTTVDIAATNTPYGWSVSWPTSFNTVVYGFQSIWGAYSLNRQGDGTFEGFSTTGMDGFVLSTSDTETVTIFCMGIGT